jgi:hypothetical protein
MKAFDMSAGWEWVFSLGAMKWLALAIGAAVVVLGCSGMLFPSLLLAIGRRSITPAGLYFVGVLRVAIGFVFIRASGVSRAPRLLRALGIIVIIAGVTTPLLGVSRATAILNWWADQGPAFIRLSAGVAVAAGSAIIYSLVAA